MPKDTETIIKQIPLFSILSPEQVADLSNKVQIREYPAGNILFNEGDRSDRFSIILQGEVEVIKALGTEDERLLAVAGQGDFLGEMSLLHADRHRTASVIARSDVRVMEMTPDAFEELIDRVPRLSFEMLREMVTRYRNSENVTIRILLEKNLELTQAFQELQAAQAQLIGKEKIEHELQMARNIQESTLPESLPELPGWEIQAHWEPARSVSGDFYDFVSFDDGRLGIIVGDVTGKGVPAALVMATSLSVLRATSLQSSSPSQILEIANNVLVKDMPPSMFVTCLYMVLDPVSGNLQVANAGHNYPLFNATGNVSEIRAKGMPLGLIPGSSYEEQVSQLSSGDHLLLYSDGLVEAHNLEGEMFGFQRLKQILENRDGEMGDSDLTTIQWLVDALTDFVGAEEEQEDDVTLVYLGRDDAVGS